MNEFVNRKITTAVAIVFAGIILVFNSYLLVNIKQNLLGLLYVFLQDKLEREKQLNKYSLLKKKEFLTLMMIKF